MSAPKVIHLNNIRLPSWALPDHWPHKDSAPLLADLEITNKHFSAIAVSSPSSEELNKKENIFNFAGRLALPSLVDAHTHLDKTFTRQRIGALKPGLLSAIDAMKADQALWSKDDLHTRVHRALTLASKQGVSYLRSHVDWSDVTPPLAWHVLAEQAAIWRDTIRLQRVALIPLPLLSNQSQVEKIAQSITESNDSIMGAFIHSSNFNADAIHWLVETAVKFDLDLDLHIDEELTPEAQGLACLLDALEKTQFTRRIVCGHVCALSQKDETEAFTLLDRVEKQPITLIALPATNLLLQDSTTNRTPHQRGITLVHEAKSRGIPVMLASDNVQDSFCALGNYDPVEALRLGVYSAHLNNAFDEWSESICRGDWLSQPKPHFNFIGQSADLTIFNSTAAACWPNNETRLLLKKGQWSELATSPFSTMDNALFNPNTLSGVSYV